MPTSKLRNAMQGPCNPLSAPHLVTPPPPPKPRRIRPLRHCCESLRLLSITS
jgi:hypothetical protein